MAQEPAKQRRSPKRQLLRELTYIRVALETIAQALQLWVASQGQPRCHVDDRVPDVIEYLAKTQVSRRTSASVAE